MAITTAIANPTLIVIIPPKTPLLRIAWATEPHPRTWNERKLHKWEWPLSKTTESHRNKKDVLSKHGLGCLRLHANQVIMIPLSTDSEMVVLKLYQLQMKFAEPAVLKFFPYL